MTTSIYTEDAEMLQTSPTADTIELIDCGSASKLTQGVPLLLLFEVSAPPLDRIFLL